MEERQVGISVYVCWKAHGEEGCYASLPWLGQSERKGQLLGSNMGGICPHYRNRRRGGGGDGLIKCLSLGFL